MIRSLLQRTLVIGTGVARRGLGRPTAPLLAKQPVTTKPVDYINQCASEKKLENLLREADKADSATRRCFLMDNAVETAEALDLPMGHKARLYEMTANAHFEAEQFKSAEKYFLISINRWVRSGVEPSSPQIIQISLRLSTIYQHNQEYQKARSGFNWCRDSAKKYLAEDDSLNSKAFYGLTLDSLGRFMYDTGHYNESIPLMKESIELAQEIAPGDLERIGVLKINFSSILVETGEVTEALEILNTIIPEADSDLDSAAVQALVNQAIIYCSKNENKKLGKECLLRALQGALQLDSPELVLLVKRHAAKFNIIIA